MTPAIQPPTDLREALAVGRAYVANVVEAEGNEFNRRDLALIERALASATTTPASDVAASASVQEALAIRDRKALECPDAKLDPTKDCPRCGADSSEPCRLRVIADGEFVDAARAALSATAPQQREARCTCAEVIGEDPNCALHGLNTEWGRKNPDFDDDAPFLAQSPAPDATTGPDKLTMTIRLTEREQEALERLMAEQELSGPQVFKCALRGYQSDHERRKAGETVTWSGDAHRAREFAGDLIPDATAREKVAKLLPDMASMLAEWDGDEPRSDWWLYQRQYADAFEILSALTQPQPIDAGEDA